MVILSYNLFIQFVIILTICVAFGVGCYFVMRMSFRRRNRQLLSEKEYLKKRLLEQNELSKSELRRQQYVIDDYKQQLKKGTLARMNSEAHQEPQTNSYQLQTLTAEAQKLEDEKLQFKNKNKKLWEQSIAIHKEKERIDLLKNDIERKHNELTSSIRYAKRIQNALLPSNEYIKELLADYFILWKPRDIVSGDFYWMKQIEQYTIVVAADCTGHGVPGGFMSMLGIAFLNEITSHNREIQSNILLDQLRELVKEALHQKGESLSPSDGMDMALCVIDNNRNTLQFSGANNPLIMVRNGELEQIKATRNPIAIYRKEKPFEITEIALQEGDVFYVFSDGYLDQFGGDNDMRLSSKVFRQLLLDVHHLPFHKQHEMLDRYITDWKGNLSQLDDILVIGFSPLLKK